MFVTIKNFTCYYIISFFVVMKLWHSVFLNNFSANEPKNESLKEQKEKTEVIHPFIGHYVDYENQPHVSKNQFSLFYFFSKRRKHLLFNEAIPRFLFLSNT